MNPHEYFFVTIDTYIHIGNFVLLHFIQDVFVRSIQMFFLFLKLKSPHTPDSGTGTVSVGNSS